MAYSVGFPDHSTEKRFEKFLSKIPRDYRDKVLEAVRDLAENPRPQGKSALKLSGPVTVFSFVAQYRLRVGSYRVFYDIDDKAKRVILLAIVRRTSTTY